MSFPTGGTALTLAINFGTACTKADPTAIKLNAKEVSRLYGGDVATWADSELDATDPILATDGCTGPVIRVFREDSASQSEILKEYLVRAENERPTGSSFTCGLGKPWSEYQKKNTEWPGKTKVGSEGTCSEFKLSLTSGGPAEVARIKEFQGSIGYADLPDEAGSGLVAATVFNAAGTSYQAPSSGEGANCTYAGIVNLPGAGLASEAVGLGNTEGKNWASNASPNEQNVTDRGSKYPICGLTFDLVYSGLANGSVNNAIGGLTADQRRTLYSYFTFVLGSTAQNLLSSADYAPLPPTWLEELREGFQENF